MRDAWISLALALLLFGCDGGDDVDAGGGGIDAGAISDASAADAGPRDAGAPDAGPRDAGAPDAGAPDAGAPDAGLPDAGGLCALPASAPFTPAGVAPFDNVAIVYDGASCSVDSDGMNVNGLIVFVNVDGLSGQTNDGWTIESATAGTILGDNILDDIPADTPVTAVFARATPETRVEATFSLNASTLTLTAFRLPE